MAETHTPEIDLEQIGVLAPQLLVQLGKLTRAIMHAVEAGTKFPREVHQETGNAVALLVKCVKKDGDYAGQRTTAGEESDQRSGAGVNAAAQAGARPDANKPGVAAQGSAKGGARVRKSRQRPDSDSQGKSEAEHEIDRQYGITL